MTDDTYIATPKPFPWDDAICIEVHDPMHNRRTIEIYADHRDEVPHVNVNVLGPRGGIPLALHVSPTTARDLADALNAVADDVDGGKGDD